MKIRISRLREIIRENLSEAPAKKKKTASKKKDSTEKKVTAKKKAVKPSQREGEELGALVDHSGRSSVAVLIDTSPLDGTTEAVKALLKDPKQISSLIRGYVQVVQPDLATGMANGAFQVKHIAGPGYGRQIYGCAYGIAQTKGYLMPSHSGDEGRDDVSPSATAAWRKAYASGRGRVKLDDMRFHTRDPKNSYFRSVDDEEYEKMFDQHDELHTGDPEDDIFGIGMNFEESEVLDSAYETTGEDIAMLEKFMDVFWEKAAENVDDNVYDKFVDMLLELGWKFFAAHYRAQV